MSRIADSRMYAHLWGTDEVRDWFDETGRLRSWIVILAALAQAQAAHDLIPEAAAERISAYAVDGSLDLDDIAAETRRTGHSTLGLIAHLEKVLPEDAARYVYYGATVQDLTDTWTALQMKAVGGVLWRDLRLIESGILDLAVRHRETVAAGRTHGQIGSATTFGVKLATWADEIRRHLERLRDGGDRWLVGQLAGSVGTLAAFGPQALAIRTDFCRRLGLDDPVISWTATRDRVADFCLVLAMISTTLARIGDEVYELQRPEIAEVGDASASDSVGSITMPHKRNPEAAEHLVTLSRLVRAAAGTVLDASVQSHERDGRGWKTEWVAFPEVCLLTTKATEIARRLVSDIEVDPDAMRRNLDITRGYWASEAALARLSPSLGKHAAQRALHTALRRGWSEGLNFGEAVAADEDLGAYLDRSTVEDLLADPIPPTAALMVDLVVARATTARRDEGDTWP